MARKKKPDPTTLGGRIAMTRLAKGWTQDRLAERMGVSRSAVAQWETDRAGQLSVNLGKLARLLEVTVEYILYGGGGGLSSSVAGDNRELTILRLFRECQTDDQDLIIRSAARFAGAKAVEALDADHPLAVVGSAPPDDC